MFIYNLKLNGSLIFKIIIGIIILIVIGMCIFVGFKIYKSSLSESNGGCEPANYITEITNENYATILKAVHENVDSYVGQKIKFSGYIYRAYDLDKDQFVLARNMIISSDFQSVIVGFLSHYKDAIKFEDKTWVEIEGTITKGSYHSSDMPIVEITSIKVIGKPDDEYVYPPDENYIPTSAIL